MLLSSRFAACHTHSRTFFSPGVSIRRRAGGIACWRRRGPNPPRGQSTSDDQVVQPTDGGLGVATGNWGCGVLRGNPELKSMLPMVAADWIRQEGWLVGELWSLICEYGQQHFCVTLFDWLLPVPGTDLDIPHSFHAEGCNQQKRVVSYLAHPKMRPASKIVKNKKLADVRQS